MRKLLFTFMVLALTTTLSAQNIQLHYDFGRNIYTGEEAGRQKVTISLEHLKIDDLGRWLYLVDFDLSSHFMESAYTEISREFNISKQSPFAAHIEYNGGLSRQGSFQQAALIGGAWNGHNRDYSKMWSLQLLYKQFFKSYDNTHAYASAQLTGVWNLNFWDRKVTFFGFIDFWRGERFNGHGCLVMLTEPQLWCNFTEHFSLGTEWELSSNFVFNQDPTSSKTFFCNPTIAAKFTF